MKNHMITRAMKNFFLLISPSLQIMSEVQHFKRLIRQALGHAFESEFSKAHITLSQYYDKLNDAVLYDVADKLLRFKCIFVHVDGFGVFHHGATRTIYLKISFKSILGELIEIFTGREGTPHITLAKNLTPEEVEKIWPVLTKNEYKDFFTFTSITVLHGYPGAWKPYMNLPLA